MKYLRITLVGVMAALLLCACTKGVVPNVGKPLRQNGSKTVSEQKKLHQGHQDASSGSHSVSGNNEDTESESEFEGTSDSWGAGDIDPNDQNQ